MESEDYEENTGGTEKSKANKGERSLFIARESGGGALEYYKDSWKGLGKYEKL